MTSCRSMCHILFLYDENSVKFKINNNKNVALNYDIRLITISRGYWAHKFYGPTGMET